MREEEGGGWGREMRGRGGVRGRVVGDVREGSGCVRGWKDEEEGGFWEGLVDVMAANELCTGTRHAGFWMEMGRVVEGYR